MGTISRSRNIPNSKDPLRGVSDVRQQLISSLLRLIKISPPQRPGTAANQSGSNGLFSGPTSLAYLFLWLSETHPDLNIDKRSPREWCLAYLDSGSGDLTHAQGLRGWGIMNEYLAWNIVKAAVTGEESSVLKLVKAVEIDFRYCPNDDNEFFSGRAGTLALLRIVRHFVPSVADQVNRCIPSLTSHILTHAPWYFHGRSYIGAAHGNIGK
ncbi:hypothetical protein BGW36DRAFT_355021 [Talaromyces proteolyticus]|uniref:Uncharacterized protein n=1 Tax=Talaromyces proteolyticus TaxID=1131652 RepID=A0AAD4L0W9_9EURO|nr:uncharacterized protein BGW36DRAFT_355021 [Talaromyces proteolyticus]KAH8703606.1 hypothetical protein BGW36DRAFT_355021 [Talaromyces proteolyticus]